MFLGLHRTPEDVADTMTETDRADKDTERTREADVQVHLEAECTTAEHSREDTTEADRAVLREEDREWDSRQVAEAEWTLRREDPAASTTTEEQPEEVVMPERDLMPEMQEKVQERRTDSRGGISPEIREELEDTRSLSRLHR